MADEPKKLEEDLVRAVEILAGTFDARSIQYAIIGGVATTMRGRLRFTQDVDVPLDVPQVLLPPLLDELARQGFEFEAQTVVREFVREHMTVLRFKTVRIDWLKPVLPLYSRALSDASCIEWTQSHSVRVATPEGLILTKLVAFRPRDQADIETLLSANRDEIDLDLIRREWAALSAGEEARTAWLENAIVRLVIGSK